MGMQVLQADERTVLSVVGDEIVPLISTRDFEVFEMSGPVGSGPPPHQHEWDEGYVMLSGSLVMTAGDETVTLRQGDRALIPGNTVHHFEIAEEGTRFLTVAGGQTVGGFFAELDEKVPPGPPTPEVFPLMAEIAAKNGIVNPYVGDGAT